MSINRFLDAQEQTFENALREIESGHKRSHWIWYIFPQIQGLGFSAISKEYAIRDMDEAKEYLADPVLRERLVRISNALLSLPENDSEKVMGYPDDLKLHSSMTLFHLADPDEPVFRLVLDKFFEGKLDSATVRILEAQVH